MRLLEGLEQSKQELSIDEKRRERIESVLEYLPTLEEARKTHESLGGVRADADVDWETITREYVEHLSMKLLPEIQRLQKEKGSEPVMAVEIGAGKGKLTKAVKAFFSAFPEINIDFKATDKKENKANDVEPLVIDEALAVYQPDIVFISWQPKATDWDEKIEAIDSVKLMVTIGEPDVTGGPMHDVIEEDYQSEVFDVDLDLVESLWQYQLGASDDGMSEERYKHFKKRFKHITRWSNLSKTMFFKRK